MARTRSNKPLRREVPSAGGNAAGPAGAELAGPAHWLRWHPGPSRARRECQDLPGRLGGAPFQVWPPVPQGDAVNVHAESASPLAGNGQGDHRLAFTPELDLTFSSGVGGSCLQVTRISIPADDLSLSYRMGTLMAPTSPGAGRVSGLTLHAHSKMLTKIIIIPSLFLKATGWE